MADIMDTYVELRQVEVQLKALQKRKSELKGQLTEAVPEGYARDGVYCKVVHKQSVSYAAALKEIKDELLPKTRHEQAEEIIEAHTKESAVVSFRPAEKDDPALEVVERGIA